MTKITKKWAVATAIVLQHSAEGLLNVKEGAFAEFFTKQSTSAGVIAVLMALVKALGKAKTGAAIGGLSGASLRSASVAWFGGGSMLAGGIVLAALGTLAGLVVWKIIEGTERQESDLTEKEAAIYNTCLLYSGLLRDKASGKSSDLKLSSENVAALHGLRADMENYLRYGCRKSRHVKSRTEKNIEELSKLLDELN